MIEAQSTPEYEAFVDKFKPKKTTDDCYTPPEIFETIQEWACKKYSIDPAKIVRPFWPGGDYESFDYPEGCVVLDNPPFSILSKICDFYLKRGIAFFLFAPSLTAFSGRGKVMRLNHVICNADIVYENGAKVKTAFITSYGDGIVAETAPDLTQRINEVSERLANKITPPKYEYPDHVVTAALLQRYAGWGVQLTIHRDDCIPISKLDEQREQGKAIFGGGLLLSDQAAAAKRRAEEESKRRAEEESKRRAEEASAATHIWTLSPREREIINSLGDK